MPLLVNNVSPAQQAANQIKAMIGQQYRQLAQAQIMASNALWKNRGATPEEIVAALGADAAAVFAFSDLMAQTLASAATIGGLPAPKSPLIPAGRTVTKNPDGTVTISTAPSSPTEK
jgi:hypothetical protein